MKNKIIVICILSLIFSTSLLQCASDGFHPGENKEYWPNGNIKTILILNDSGQVTRVNEFDKNGELYTNMTYFFNKPYNGFSKELNENNYKFEDLPKLKYIAYVNFKDGKITNGYKLDIDLKFFEKSKLKGIKFYKNGIEEYLTPDKFAKIINFLDKEDQTNFIKRNWQSFQYLNNPSKEDILWAININGQIIEYVNNPSDDLIKLAINNNGYAIFGIKNPTENQIIESLYKESGVINGLSNPTEEMVHISLAGSPTSIYDSVVNKKTIYKGMQFYHYGDYNKAYEIFNKNISNSYSLYYLGKMYQKGQGIQKDENKAKEYFINSSNEGNIDAKIELYKIYENENKLEIAINMLNDVVKKRDLISLNKRLADLYFSNKEYEKSEAIFNKLLENGYRKAIEIVVNNYKKLNNIEKMNTWIAKFNYDEILKAIKYKDVNKKILEIGDSFSNNGSYEISYYLGQYYFDDKNCRLANKYFEKVLNHNESKKLIIDTFTSNAYEMAEALIDHNCENNNSFKNNQDNITSNSKIQTNDKIEEINKPAKIEEKSSFSIDDLVLNITDAKGREKLFKLDLNFDTRNKNTFELLNSNKDNITNIIIETTFNYTAEKLNQESEKNEFLEEIKSKVIKNILNNDDTGLSEIEAKKFIIK